MGSTSSRGRTGTDAPALDALGNPACRRILLALKRTDGPLTADDLSGECDVPLSTVYRKLDRLSAVDLVEETVRFRRVGKHTRQYRATLDSLRVELDEDGFEVRVVEER